MIAIWQTLIVNPIFNLLIVLYRFTGNLGIAIIVFTIIVRAILIPATLPAIKMTKKQRDIQPELDKLKEKYKYDKQKQAALQMELMKKHGINPASGCLTTVITLIVMIAIYRSVSTLTVKPVISNLNNMIYFQTFKFQPTELIATKFLYLDLAKPDPFLIFTVIAVLLQFLATKMMMPYTELEEKAVKQTKEKKDDILYSMQQQNLYTMPIIFFIFGLTLPSGVMIYIITSTLFQILQTYYFSGWGGLKPWIKKVETCTVVYNIQAMNKLELINSSLSDIFGFLDIKPEVSVNESSEGVYDINIKGENISYLIGYQGQTLEALRAFLNLVIFRKTNEPATLVIDINGYKDRKNEKIQYQTKSLIDKVRFFEKEVEMTPMNAWERRQVHVIVAEYPDIVSESVGEGRDRRVVLKPRRHKADGE